MNKKFKKFMSVILCAVILFTTASVAFAAEDNAEVLEKNYACHNYYSNGFIVVTFNSKYSQTGEIPEVYLNDGSSIYPVAEDDIDFKVFEHGGIRYPQLFISNINNSEDIIGVEIGTGAFATESGEISGKVVIPQNRINRSGNFGVSCEFEAIKLEERTSLISGKFCYYATVGKPVKLNGYSEHGKMWLGEMTATYTVNGKTTKINSNEFIPQEPGKYVVELKLGDVVTKTFEIDVLGEKEIYSKNLGNATKLLVTSPFYFVLGVVMLLVPGMGMVVGAFSLYSVSLTVSNFFTALFDGPVYKKHTLY